MHCFKCNIKISVFDKDPKLFVHVQLKTCFSSWILTNWLLPSWLYQFWVDSEYYTGRYPTHFTCTCKHVSNQTERQYNIVPLYCETRKFIFIKSIFFVLMIVHCDWYRWYGFASVLYNWNDALSFWCTHAFNRKTRV